ncbi:MAG: response regulator transcription factor [Opitutaceae bacterium]|jgi:DNA-binding response OmpR family regulator
MKILIADDDLTSRAALTAVLHKYGHEVLATCDGAEAWNVLQRSDAPRLAILDWEMPGLDGIEVCRRSHTREMDQPPYLILLTTRGEKKDVTQGLHAGADDYLAKPFDPAELNARVEVGCRLIALQDRLASRVQELQEALAHIKILRGIVPICSGCKKIRDDAGFWNQVEAYVSAHSEAKFSHGLCPDCMRKYYPGVAVPTDTTPKKKS